MPVWVGTSYDLGTPRRWTVLVVVLQLIFAVSLVATANSATAANTSAAQSGVQPPAVGSEPIPKSEIALVSSQQHISQIQAEDDLEIQSKAGNIAGELQEHLGSGFAGIWFDLHTGVFHIDLAPSTNKAIAEHLAVEAEISQAVTFDSVKHTWSEVEVAARDEQNHLESLATDQRAAVITSAQSNAPIV
jgi:hypothetical protein